MAYIYAYSNGGNWSGMLRLNYGMRSMRFTIWFGWTTYWTLSKTITQVDHNTLNNHHLQEYLEASSAGSSDDGDTYRLLARPGVLPRTSSGCDETCQVLLLQQSVLARIPRRVVQDKVCLAISGKTIHFSASAVLSIALQPQDFFVFTQQTFTLLSRAPEKLLSSVKSTNW